MTDYNTTEVEGTDLEQRDVCALTEYMTVLSEGGDIYTVVGQNGNGEYHVDARKERCTCPDHQYRGVECKHQRRAAFATGKELLDFELLRAVDVDPQIVEHASGLQVVISDGGVIEDDGNSDYGSGEELGSTGSKGGGSGEKTTNDDGRPEDCNCGAWNYDSTLACWPCYRDGFETPNPDTAGDDE